MASIRSKDTAPEIRVRHTLHSIGFRFRLHVTKLPGKPDLVLPKFRAVIFVNGCFWHGHDCNLFRMPSTRRQFWESKIQGNRNRDFRIEATLVKLGWRVMTVWECALKNATSAQNGRVAEKLAQWVLSNRKKGVVRGARGT